MRRRTVVTALLGTWRPSWSAAIVRDDPSVNEPWSWHIDPATLEFAGVTIEVCDGLPSFVEDGSLTSDTYCPWSAEVISIAD